MAAYPRALVVLIVAAAVGCGDDGHELTNVATYQACFDQHDDPGVQTPIESIVECCLDHKIDNVRYACGMTIPDCINYLTANLSQFDASTIEVLDACAEYYDKLPPSATP